MATAQSDCQWTQYIPWVSTALLGAYVIYQFVKRDKRCDWVNKNIQKDLAKIATPVDIEDLGDQTAFCRCWRTKNWPYCDGSHNQHNKCTGDNVGPLIVKKGTK